MKWNPGKVIERLCRAHARAAARAIRSASPAVPHRDGGAPGSRTPGGSLASVVESSAFVVAKAWGAVIRWADLGASGMWFVNGTTRQKARPIPLVPPVSTVYQAVKEDAERYWAERCARMGRAS